MLRGSAVLRGCVRKEPPPPASDWPTNFRFYDAHGGDVRGSDAEASFQPRKLDTSGDFKPQSRTRRLAFMSMVSSLFTESGFSTGTSNINVSHLNVLQSCLLPSSGLEKHSSIQLYLTGSDQVLFNGNSVTT